LDNQEDVLEQTELIEHVITDSTVQNINILYNFFYSNKDILMQFNEFKKNFKLNLNDKN
jgi:Mn-dependent DtxR family transcriptional regulator